MSRRMLRLAVFFVTTLRMLDDGTTLERPPLRDEISWRGLRLCTCRLAETCCRRTGGLAGAAFGVSGFLSSGFLFSSTVNEKQISFITRKNQREKKRSAVAIKNYNLQIVFIIINSSWTCLLSCHIPSPRHHREPQNLSPLHRSRHHSKEGLEI